MSGIEILGVAAGVLQIADLGGKLSVKLFTFTRKIKNADRNIDSISQDIAATGAVLQQLGNELKKDEKLRLCSPEAIATAKSLMEQCRAIFQELNDAVDGKGKGLGSGAKVVLGLKQRLKYPFLEPQIELLKANLEKLKSSLMVMLNVLIFAEQLKNQEALPILKDQRELLKSLVEEKMASQKQYDQVLKRLDQLTVGKDDLSLSSLNNEGTKRVDSGINLVNLALTPQDMASTSTPDLLLPSLPAHLHDRADEIFDHCKLISAVINEVHHTQYNLDRGIRYRTEEMVLDSHYNEWAHQVDMGGSRLHYEFLSKSPELKRHWERKNHQKLQRDVLKRQQEDWRYQQMTAQQRVQQQQAQAQAQPQQQQQAQSQRIQRQNPAGQQALPPAPRGKRRPPATQPQMAHPSLQPTKQKTVPTGAPEGLDPGNPNLFMPVPRTTHSSPSFGSADTPTQRDPPVQSAANALQDDRMRLPLNPPTAALDFVKDSMKDGKNKQPTEPARRRATMNSRAAYDEDEMLRRAIQESREMGTGTQARIANPEAQKKRMKIFRQRSGTAASAPGIESQAQASGFLPSSHPDDNNRDNSTTERISNDNENPPQTAHGPDGPDDPRSENDGPTFNLDFSTIAQSSVLDDFDFDSHLNADEEDLMLDIGDDVMTPHVAHARKRVNVREDSDLEEDQEQEMSGTRKRAASEDRPSKKVRKDATSPANSHSAPPMENSESLGLSPPLFSSTHDIPASRTGNVAQPLPRAIQPRPSPSTDSPNPAYMLRPEPGGERRKKRGRPTKAEVKERSTLLAAEGKVYEATERPATTFRTSLPKKPTGDITEERRFWGGSLQKERTGKGEQASPPTPNAVDTAGDAPTFSHSKNGERQSEEGGPSLSPSQSSNGAFGREQTTNTIKGSDTGFDSLDTDADTLEMKRQASRTTLEKKAKLNKLVQERRARMSENQTPSQSVDGLVSSLVDSGEGFQQRPSEDPSEKRSAPTAVAKEWGDRIYLAKTSMPSSMAGQPLGSWADVVPSTIPAGARVTPSELSQRLDEMRAEINTKEARAAKFKSEVEDETRSMMVDIMKKWTLLDDMNLERAILGLDEDAKATLKAFPL